MLPPLLGVDRKNEAEPIMLTFSERSPIDGERRILVSNGTHLGEIRDNLFHPYVGCEFSTVDLEAICKKMRQVFHREATEWLERTRANYWSDE